MPEDAVRKEQQPGVSRREFLKRAAALTTVAGLPVMRLFSTPQTAEAAQVEPPEIPGDEIAERYAELRKRIRESALDKNEKFWSVGLIYDAERADRNLKVLSAQKLTNTMLSLIRQRFKNPDIASSQNIFMNHQLSFGAAISGLENIDWGNSDSTKLKLDFANLLGSKAYGGGKIRLPYGELMRIYGRLGTAERVGLVEIQGSPQGAEKDFLSRQQDIISVLPLPETDLFVQVTKPKESFAFQSGLHSYRFGGYSLLEIYISRKEPPSQSEIEQETYLFVHEVGHAIDIWTNPGLFLYMSPDEVIELSMLREKAANSANLTGDEATSGIPPSSLEADQVVSSIPEISRYKTLTPQEVEFLTRIYPWREIADEVVKTNIFKKYMEKDYEAFAHGQIPISERTIYSWQEFLGTEREALQKIRHNNPLFNFILTKVESDEVPIPSSWGLSAAWMSELFDRTGPILIARDLLQEGKLKQVLGENEYRTFLEETYAAWHDAEEEILAEKFATYVFLKHVRGQDLSPFEGDPYLQYVRRISEILGKKGVVLTFDERAVTKIREHRQEMATV